jgi:two-component system, NarL family, nitrate/nitrite response regulator NarL
MANGSIALESISSANLSIVDRTRPSTAVEAASSGFSNEQLAYPSFVDLEKARCAALAFEGRVDNQPIQSIVTFLIEPNGLLREGLRRILTETRYTPAALASCLEEIGSLPVPEGSVSIFIMDAAQDCDNACHQLREIKDRDPASRVVMLVNKYDLQQVLAAFHSGADAYLMKSISCEVLLKALDLVILGEPVFPAAALVSLRSKNALVDPGQSKILSDRELAILRCLMDGNSNKVIARKLDIAEATVKVHVKAILRKTHARNRTQAAMWGTSHLVGSR